MEAATLTQTKQFKVIEFYSGIGGMRMVLDTAGIKYSQIIAYEINEHANAVYQANFNEEPRQTDIRSVTKEFLDSFGADIWTMSPPCQPHTRQGKRLDTDDERSKSYLHILQVLSTMENPPNMILLENVKNFEESDSCSNLLKILEHRDYDYRQFLLTPSQIGIPNERLRYYLVARRTPFQDKDSGKAEYLRSIDVKIPPNFEDRFAFKLNCDTIGDFLKFGDDLESFDQEYLLKDNQLKTFLDIITRDSTGSCCFTKSYGRYFHGSGSVLQFKKLEKDPEKMEDFSGVLRMFTPEEVMTLQGFPKAFTFPAGLTKIQKYKLLGNSINVFVIYQVFNFLLTP